VQLTRAAAAALAVHAACVGTALAQDGDGAVRIRSALYQDDDATTVVTAAVEANGVVAETVGIRAGYLIDVITTASVDVVTAATGRWDERRDEVRGGVDVFLGDATVNAGVVRSIENDFDSWTVSFGGSVDLAQRATTLGAGVAWIRRRASTSALAESARHPATRAAPTPSPIATVEAPSSTREQAWTPAA
jgi:hypothetical protein